MVEFYHIVPRIDPKVDKSSKDYNFEMKGQILYGSAFLGSPEFKFIETERKINITRKEWESEK